MSSYRVEEVCIILYILTPGSNVQRSFVLNSFAKFKMTTDNKYVYDRITISAKNVISKNVL